ncbi:insulinase family protein [Actinomadura roseirufa]|uniref:insulinase family protein n=1 Tax=Actinomadura roseirufa TaxID=2094049 RepID=UPI001041B6D5|nr:insulinase family protein [Actinomadura roseirufa]
MEIVRTEVDEVPVFWTEGRPGDDGYQAVLMFRVGQADETLARSGLTHLVEHLALHAVGESDYHYNGAVDSVTTTFVTHGEPGKVSTFLTAVCDALHALPMDRLEAEKQILRTEAEGRDNGLVGQLLLWRYGAATYGLPAYDEHGLASCAADDVQAWAARWFTRRNAALALIGGPPPEGLRLPLPDGERRPVPKPTSALPRTPAYFTSNVKGVALTGIVPRNAAASLHSDFLRRRLHRVLRRDGALSYTTDVDYAHRDGATAQVLAFADGLADVRPALTERFLGEFDRIADEPVDAAEWDEVVTARRTRLTSDEARAPRAVAHCLAELLGSPLHTTADLLTALDELKPPDVQDIGRAVRDSALLMLPRGQEPPGARFHPAPAASMIAVDGRVHTRPDEARLGLITGPAGVTALTGSAMATVPFDACAAVLAWPDGARLLIGLDGMTVGVEPNVWPGGDGIVAELDRNAPAGLVVPMPARSDEQIPPRAVGEARPPADPPDGGGGLLGAVFGLPGRLRSRRYGPVWQDGALAAALPEVRAGDFAAGLRLLAGTREDAETRALYTEILTEAAAGRSDALTRMAADAPGDPDLLLWLGSTRIEEAWRARSAYRAEYVSNEQFGRFWQLLALAGRPLTRAAELLPADPVPWDRLQWHGIGMQVGRDELDRIWRELCDRHPSLYAAHISRSQALSKKWWGSDAEVLDFAEAAVAAAEPGDPVTAVLAVAHLEVGAELGTMDDLNAYLAGPRVHAALAEAADRWLAAPRPHPRALEAHHFFGAVFYRAGDHDRARRHLGEAGRTTAPSRAWAYAPDADRLLARARRDLRL